MKDITFIADFFNTDGIGGAELNDSILISHLQNRGLTINRFRSHEITDEDIISSDFIIVSNFVGLSARHKEIIKLKKYVIYEHDHKYLKSRNPSIFKDFIAPSEELINIEFYRNAKAVVVLSEICKQIIEKNLQLDNVYSIGCSLWSEEKLDFISSICNKRKNNKYCVLKSPNLIKGTKQAIAYCQSKNLSFDLVGQLPEKELLSKLVEYEYFVFVPQVLETLSRIVVEAKMLNCKVMTNKNLVGAASEDWFNESGNDLIDTIREKINSAIDLFESLIKDESVTVILNCYRRPEYLQEQIKAVRSQTKKIDNIWIWVNYHDDNKSVDFSQFDVDRIIKNDYNWKFYGRFAGAMLSDDKFIAMFDDDTIPGPKWIENCLNTMYKSEGILGGAGVRLAGDKYIGHERFGWSSANEEIVEVDLVGHAWFFKREWLKYLWMEKPFTWHNGEDIQFSYCAQKYGGVKTYCPPHPKDQLEMFSSLKGYQLGVDDKATSRSRNHAVFYAQRDACVKNAVMNGWKPLYIREN